MRISALTVIALLAFARPAAADEPMDNEFFEKKVRPILVANCVGCHGPKKQKGGLRLDSRAGFTQGRRNRPALVKPGDPEKSLLVQVIRYDGDIKMPQKGKLPDADIATLTAWVKGGAPWPDDAAAGRSRGSAFDLHARAKAQWSFQPVTAPAVPEIRNSKFEIRNRNRPVPAGEARVTAGCHSLRRPTSAMLLRRVYFDLIGLPPTPEEIDAFLKDDSPDAYEKVVDDCSRRPHYGERWGRHWLDLVRYAETHGHEFDFEIPDAWRYRDYVIRAFNADCRSISS